MFPALGKSQLIIKWQNHYLSISRSCVILCICLSPSKLSSSVLVCLFQGSRSSGKVHSFGKREQSIKRNPNVPVVVRGWLYKQVRKHKHTLKHTHSRTHTLAVYIELQWSKTKSRGLVCCWLNSQERQIKVFLKWLLSTKTSFSTFFCTNITHRKTRVLYIT